MTSLQVVKPNLWGLINIQKQLLWCMIQQIPFPKSRPLQQGVQTVQMVPYELKFNTKIGRYPGIPFMVMRFKERHL